MRNGYSITRAPWFDEFYPNWTCHRYDMVRQIVSVIMISLFKGILFLFFMPIAIKPLGNTFLVCVIYWYESYCAHNAHCHYWQLYEDMKTCFPHYRHLFMGIQLWQIDSIHLVLIKRTLGEHSHSALSRPLVSYVKLPIAHALGMPGTVSPPPQGQRSRHASGYVRDARAVMHAGIAK